MTLVGLSEGAPRPAAGPAASNGERKAQPPVAKEQPASLHEIQEGDEERGSEEEYESEGEGGEEGQSEVTESVVAPAAQEREAVAAGSPSLAARAKAREDTIRHEEEKKIRADVREAMGMD